MTKESPQTNVEKKPFYKQWWFWVIVVVVLLVGIGGSGSSNNNSTSNNSSNDTNGSLLSTEKAPECSEEEKVEIIDLSSMGANDIAMWAKDNGLELKIGSASYSDTVEREGLLTQSISAGTKVCKGATLTVSYSLGKEPTMEQKNALAKAKSYSDNLHMSKNNIYNQLTSEYGEGFSAEAAQYAIDNLVADYKANALAKAQSYQQNMHMSRSAIYDQLISEYGEGFTPEEAQYAIDNLPE